MDKPIFCYACGEELDEYNILICAECLGKECDRFVHDVEDDEFLALPEQVKTGPETKDLIKHDET